MRSSVSPACSSFGSTIQYSLIQLVTETVGAGKIK